MTRPTVLAYGFRTFFLLAPAWGAVALTLWTLMLAGRIDGPALPAAQWHGHEMLFGFTMAAAAGFFMTAITHWCSRPPLAGTRLAATAALWAAGRAAVWWAGSLPPLLVAAVDVAFPVALGFYVSTVLLRHGQPRDRVLPPVFLAFVVADLLFHAEWLGWLEDGAAVGWRLFLAAVAFKIAEVGGRIIPTFMEAWLPARDLPKELVRRRPALDVAAKLSIVAYAAAELAAPGSAAADVLALLAATVNAVRLADWRGWMSWRDPLMAVLHLAYAWVIVGLALDGLDGLAGVQAPSALLHGLAAGAIGTWALALMSRASLGHTGRPLKVAWWMVPAYAAVVAGAVLRVVEPWVPAQAASGLYASAAGLWSLGFLIFLGGYGRWLVSPRIDGKPG